MIVLPLIPSRLDAEALDVELGVQESDVRGAGGQYWPGGSDTVYVGDGGHCWGEVLIGKLALRGVSPGGNSILRLRPAGGTGGQSQNTL